MALHLVILSYAFIFLKFEKSASPQSLRLSFLNAIAKVKKELKSSRPDQLPLSSKCDQMKKHHRKFKVITFFIGRELSILLRINI